MIGNLPPSVSDSEIVMGLAFPFQLGATGFPAMATPQQVVFYHIVSLLLTGKNEKVMNTDVGVNIHPYIFENLTTITMARVANAVKRAISLYVPSVKVLKVKPEISKNEDGTESTIIVFVQYRINGQTYDQQIPIPTGNVQGAQGNTP